MYRRLSASCTVCVVLAMTGGSSAQITIQGTNGTPSGDMGGVTAYLVPSGKPGCPITCEPTDAWSGQWVAHVEQSGVCTAAIEEAYGFGPVLRPGIAVRDGGDNRVNVVLPFAYDLLEPSSPAEEKHAEFGQTFLAAGTSISAVALKDAAGVLISLHEKDAAGAQVGRSVRAASFHPPDALPTVPGHVYYLRFAREDGAPFRMHVVENNRYLDGAAHFDGKSRSQLDLALRIQHNPSGQILRHKPGMSEVCNPAVRSYGQTFIAKGTSLGMLSVFPAYGDKPPFEPTIRLLRSGPSGNPIGPAVASRILVFNPGQLKLVPGERYYIEITIGQAEGPLRMWASTGDDFEGGELHIDGQAVRGRDLAMVLVEYEQDRVAPPAPTCPSAMPGSPPYARRFIAEGRVRIVWDLPASSDIASMVVRRFDPARKDAEPDGQVIAKIPASAQGRYSITDTGLMNEVAYQYTIRAVDAAGNESEALKAPVLLRPGVPLSAELLNGDFSGPSDAGMPYGWTARTLGGPAPAFRIDAAKKDAGAKAAAGWEVSEEARRSDTVLAQRVPCEKGRTYRLTAEARLWNPWSNREMIILAMVGIDPAGGDDPLAESVVWSSPTYQQEGWDQLVAAAVAQADSITIYLRGHSQYARLMNTRFRDVTLRDVTYDK